MAVVKISCLVAVVCMVVVVVAPYAAEAITCGEVQGKMVPCLGYLRNGGAVPGSCCNGVRSLNGMARTTADRQQACRCLQSAAISIAGIKAPFAAALPSKCGVIIPYKISRSTDCSKSKIKEEQYLGQTLSVGLDKVDLGKCREKGIRVSNTPDVLTEDVADLAIGLILTTLRRLCESDRNVRSGLWKKGDFKLTTKPRTQSLRFSRMGEVPSLFALCINATRNEILFGDDFPQIMMCKLLSNLLTFHA